MIRIIKNLNLKKNRGVITAESKQTRSNILKRYTVAMQQIYKVYFLLFIGKLPRKLNFSTVLLLEIPIIHPFLNHNTSIFTSIHFSDFLELLLSASVCMRACACVHTCVSAPEAINNYSGLMWCDIDPI